MVQSGQIDEKLIITPPVVKATGLQILVAGFLVIIECTCFEILPLGSFGFFVGQFGGVAVHALLLVVSDLILRRASSLLGNPEVHGREDPLYGRGPATGTLIALVVETPLQECPHIVVVFVRHRVIPVLVPELEAERLEQEAKTVAELRLQIVCIVE